MSDLDILGITQLGDKLSSALDLHTEACHQARTNGIPKLTSLINSTSTLLRKVHELSQQAPNAFTEVCINDINGLAATCRVLYEGTLVLLVKREKHNEENKQVGTPKQEEVESLLSSLAAKTYTGYKVWDRLEPRLKICQQELRHVKFELMLRFLLGSIAQFQLSNTTRSPGDWESERSMRLSAENIAKRRVLYHIKYIEKREHWAKNDDASSSSKVSIEENGSAVTDSSSVTIAPPSIHDDELADKNAKAESDIEPETSKASPDTVQPITQDKEDNSSILADTTTPSLDISHQNWFQRLFSRNSRDQWKDEDVEAYTLNIRNGNKHVAKLLLEQDEIRTALRKLTNKHFWNRHPGLMEQYASLDGTIRQDVDEAISTTKQKQCRKMTFVAMSARKVDSSTGINNGFLCTSEVSITLFFTLGVSYAPIYIIDTFNRKWDVPYTSCETVKMIRDLIPTLGGPPMYKPPTIINGNFTISTEDNVTVTPETWESVRRPGMVIRLHIYPSLMGSCPAPPRVWASRSEGSTVSTASSFKRPRMADVYQEMDGLLKLSNCWMPDEATVKQAGLGNLLRLWTNAIDTEAQDCDAMSDWSCSSESDFYD